MAEDKTSIQVGDSGDEDRQGGEGIDIMDLDLGGGDDSASSGGGAGNDTLTGGSGRDIFYFGEGHGTDTIADFNVAHDKIHLRCFDETITWDVLSTKITTVTDANDVVTGVQIDLSDWGGGTVILEGVASTALTADMFILDDFAGTAGADTIEGTSRDDRLTGGEGADTFVFDKESGDDTITGLGGDDTLTGGEGADTFVFESGHGADTITDFSDGEDTIDLSAFTGITGFSDLTVTQNGNNTVITVPGGGTVTLQDFTSTDLDETDFAFHDSSPDGQQDGM